MPVSPLVARLPKSQTKVTPVLSNKIQRGFESDSNTPLSRQLDMHRKNRKRIVISSQKLTTRDSTWQLIQGSCMQKQIERIRKMTDASQQLHPLFESPFAVEIRLHEREARKRKRLQPITNQVSGKEQSCVVRAHEAHFINIRDIATEVLSKQSNLKMPPSKLISEIQVLMAGSKASKSHINSSLCQSLQNQQILKPEVFVRDQVTNKVRLDKNNEKIFQSKVVEPIKFKTRIPHRLQEFKPPFETYYYRNLIFKVNWSNEMYIEAPLEYQHRLKAYVGRGNNSCMVSGLLQRRIWFAITDKIEEANFVWTQLKQLSYLQKQPNKQIKKKQQHNEHNDKKCTKQQTLNTFQRQIQQQKKDYSFSTKHKKTQKQEQLQYDVKGILTKKQNASFKKYFNEQRKAQQRCDERMLPRKLLGGWTLSLRYPQLRQQRLHNHLINNYLLGNKKTLFSTLTHYYTAKNKQLLKVIPCTFHIQHLEEQNYFRFLRQYYKRSKCKGRNIWIVKPGENSNRGQGIVVCLTLQQIKQTLKRQGRHPDGSAKTYMVQAYIDKPLLYKQRKIDLRHYIMVSSVNGLLKGYWYEDGYCRTTSSQYSLDTASAAIHLTNDAVQKNLPDYGKYERGNKISYQDLNNYIDKHSSKTTTQNHFYQNIYPRMRQIATDAIRAASAAIDPTRKQNNFQIFGLDFMIDAALNVWLIEINTNPCLQLSCPLLGMIIPRMLQNAFELTLDAMYPPPLRYTPKGMHYGSNLEQKNKFHLVYDERIQPPFDGALQMIDHRLLADEDQTFQDDGEEWHETEDQP